VLIQQHAISKHAFKYWNELQSQTTSGGGLYDTQPYSSTGNIYNVDDPAEKVLGYFYATQLQESRLSFHNHFDFNVDGFTCQLDTIYDYTRLFDDFPHYLIDPEEDGTFPFLYGDKKCFDCRIYGGEGMTPQF
jgi:hypothetical protein